MKKTAALSSHYFYQERSTPLENAYRVLPDFHNHPPEINLLLRQFNETK